MADSKEDTVKFMYKLLHMMQYTKDRVALPVSFNLLEKEVIGFLSKQNAGTKLSIFYPAPFFNYEVLLRIINSSSYIW